MAKIEIIWQGDRQAQITHVPSGTQITTDAGVAERSFAPTDLVAAALGSCILTVMDAYAQARNIDLKGTRIVTAKTSSQELRQIIEISVDIYFSGSFSDKEQISLKRVAETCFVGNSLHPDLKKSIRYHFDN